MWFWLVGRLVICSCPNVKCDDLLSQRSQSWLPFWTFIDHFIVAFGSNHLQKTLGGKFADWVRKKKEKYLLNCKYKVTFQPDGCVEPTCAVTCFIHFGFSHHLDNIWLLKCTFVVFYLGYFFFWFFIDFAWELIWNVLVNQKGFLYITQMMY